MKISPWILGAAVLVPVAGAFIGKNMSTEPIGVHADVLATIPERPRIAAAAPLRNTHQRLPDHYALETPEGRIEVAELAWHGRYRDRMRYVQSPAFASYDVDADLARMEARWDSDANTIRTAAALDGQQPRITRYAQAPHYAALENARTGEATAEAAPTLAVAQPDALPGNMRVVSVSSEPAVRARRVDVRAELALNQ